MSKPFLQNIAEKIIAEHENNFHRLCVVFPNRRAALFLREYLTATLKKSFIMPTVLSMEDFIEHYTPETVIDQPALLFTFYRVYLEIKKEEADSFEEFIKWAQVLLKDFSDMDRHLTDPNQLFGYLNDAKVIEHWNPESLKLTPLQEKYLEFWKSFHPLYNALNKKLAEENMITESLAYRKIAGNVSGILSEKRFETFMFAGFNALTLSEEKIISRLVDEGKASLIWDTDKYYADNPNHEAGKYIRKFQQSLARGHVFLQSNSFSETDKKITVIGIPQQVGQAFVAGKILTDSFGSVLNEKTAVVLADENLLFPVLNALPLDSEQPNITMGYPLSQTLFHDLVFTLFSLHSHKRINEAKAEGSYYYKDVVRLLTHPYLNGLCKELNPLGGISGHIASQNRVMLTRDDVLSIANDSEKETFEKVSPFFFGNWENPIVILENLNACAEFFALLFSKNTETKNDKSATEKEFLAEYSKLIRRLKDLFAAHQEISDPASLHLLVKQLARSTKIPFYGEPLKGMQIMGVLETRNLDFENLVLLSVNEGVLPSGRTEQSLIPLDIRSHFGMPTYREQDAIYAYHFYRLLQRAKNVFILYNNDTEGYGKAEKSRFIIQLLHELPSYNKDVIIEEKVFHPEIRFNNSKLISFEKTPFVMQRLNEIALRGFSPSQLSRYIRCPLQFYYSAVAKLGEAEELEETIESSTLGSVIHEMLEKIYTPFIGKVIDPDKLLASIASIEQLSKDAFEKVYEGGDISRGKNLLSWKIAMKQTERFLRFEADQIKKTGMPVTLMKLEEALDCDLLCPLAGNVKLFGKIDRIDSVEGCIRIIDYKSGSVKKEDVKLKELSAMMIEPKLAKAFQLCMYALLFHTKFPEEKSVLQPAIIGLQKISEGPFYLNLKEKDSLDSQFYEEFSLLVSGLIDEIFNPKFSFTPAKKSDPCSNCSYQQICARYTL
ncbi:MAG: PD-(D/E)XK nuclease family protein [Bacteroidota bacterium]